MKYLKLILLTFFVSVLLLNLAKAEIQSLPAQKQYSCVNIQQTCANCTFVNIDSITYPNSSKTYLNTAMTKEGYGYIYKFCDTNILGKYIVTTCGDIDAELTCVDYDFKVTPTGDERGISFILILSLGAFIILVLGLYLKIYYFGFIAGVMLLVIGTHTLIYGFNNVIDLTTNAVAYVNIGLGIFFIIISSYEWILGEEGEEE